MNIKYLIVFVLLLISSCSEEISHGRTSFPDIRVTEYQYKDELIYNFYPETPFGPLIDDFEEDKFYAYNDIVFQGWANGEEIKLSNEKIRTDVREYLYDNSPEYIENVVAEFIHEDLLDLKIYSNQDFNSVKAGESLNHLFEVSSRLIIHKKNKFIVFDGNILDKSKLNNSFVPFGLKIRLQSPPKIANKYDFFIEVKTNNKLFTSKIITVSLASKL